MIGPNLSAFAIRARSLTIYLMLVAVFAGTFAFLNLGRDEDPTFTIKTMLVTAVWPGATVDETMSQVTERLERTLEEVPGLDSVRSVTRPGITTIYVDLEESWPADRVPDSWYEARKRVGDIRHTLPAGVRGPFFNDDFGDVFAIVYGFTADGFSPRELRDAVDGVRDALLAEVSGIAKVDLIGAQDEEVLVELDPAEVAARGLDYGQIFAAIAAQNVVRPSGTINTGTENLSLRVTGAFETEADVADVSLVANGRTIRLGDIATIRRAFVDPPTPLYRVDGERAIGLAISMREGGDVLELGKAVTAAMTTITAGLPVGIEPHLVADQAEIVTHAIGDFTTSLWQAILIILAVSFLTLGVRPGAVVAVAIPVTIAMVFVVMQVLGIDLHRVSLGALIIALALLVDDAMTTVDAMLRRLAAGDRIKDAAEFAYRTLAAPMLTGTLVTIAGFIPIGFAASNAGEYTRSIFEVVGIALIASWFAAVLFTPVIGSALLKAPAVGTAPARPGFLLRGYAAILRVAIRIRWITIAAAAGLFAVAIAAVPLVDQQFFPPSDRNELIIDLQMPRSSSIYASETAVSGIEKWLAARDDVASFSSYVGQNVIRFYLPLDIRPPADNHSQIVVVAKDVDSRLKLETDLPAFLGEAYPEAISRVSPLELGPPVGWPLQYRVSGPDVERVRSEAMALASVVAANPGARSVHFDWIEPARDVRIVVDQDRARRLGLTSAQLADVLQAAVSGSTITQLRDGIYLVNVVGRASETNRVTLDTLQTLQVPVPGGRTVSLSQFATFVPSQEQPVVWRRDRVPTLTVLADVAPGVSPESVVAGLSADVAAFDAALPAGYRVETGGTAETSAQSRAAVFAVVPLMVFVMLTLLMVQLQNFRRVGMVVLLLPLGLIGVVGALLAFGRPLGFVAILGVLALIGMIAKNAVILITQIVDEEASGKPTVEAVVAAATSRLRPLMLTALSTILGLLPIAPTLFWGPMAFAIMGGLLVATILTLIVLPALYVALSPRRAAPSPSQTVRKPGDRVSAE
jgi:multidrug efflux pump subunit AcrB